MADLPDITGLLPSTSKVVSIGTTTVKWITIFITFVIFIAIAGVLLYIFLKRLKYNKKIIIWEKVGNNWEITGRDRAMELKYDLMGNTVFALKKRKKYLPRPEIQTGRKTYWYAILEDGEWMNVGMKDINTQMKEANVKFIHPGMSYARSGLYKIMRERYEKKGFMEKYGHIIIPLIFFAVIGVLLWLNVDKMLGIANSLQTSVELSNKMSSETTDKINQVLSSLENICTGPGVREGG